MRLSSKTQFEQERRWFLSKLSEVQADVVVVFCGEKVYISQELEKIV